MTSTQGAGALGALFYAARRRRPDFLSSPTRHCRDSRCSRAAPRGYSRPATASIRGIQIEGTASELHGDERSHAQQLYGDRFPFVRPGIAPAPIALALGRVRWFRLRMSRLHFIDNLRGFGQRQQFDA
jgi:uncharacterized protein YhbP (UPF0306 family)